VFICIPPIFTGCFIITPPIEKIPPPLTPPPLSLVNKRCGVEWGDDDGDDTNPLEEEDDDVDIGEDMRLPSPPKPRFGRLAELREALRPRVAKNPVVVGEAMELCLAEEIGGSVSGIDMVVVDGVLVGGV
jgi:hypothetical protein